MLGRVTFTNKLVAKKLNIDESKVASVTDFFYKEFENELKECRYPYIYVKDLGTFGLHIKAIERRIIFLRLCIKNEKDREARGVVYSKREKMILGMRREIFYMFGVRRMLKNRIKENRQLRKNGKNLNDNKG